MSIVRWHLRHEHPLDIPRALVICAVKEIAWDSNDGG